MSCLRAPESKDAHFFPTELRSDFKSAQVESRRTDGRDLEQMQHDPNLYETTRADAGLRRASYFAFRVAHNRGILQ